MAQTTAVHFSFILLSLTLFLLAAQIEAQSSSAQGPSGSSSSAGAANITGILEKAGQFNTFISFLGRTQVGNQINNQVNNSNDGMTVLAPTDNAFQNLPSGTLNRLTDQQQVQLVLFHVIPKFYGIDNLQTVSNPVRTQASGQNGGVFGLNFTGQPNQNQVNVTSGPVNTTIYNAIRKEFPLAVYQVDKVLLPQEFFESSNKTSSSPPPTSNGNSSDAANGNPPSDDPSSAAHSNRMTTVGFGLVSALLLFCMGFI